MFQGIRPDSFRALCYNAIFCMRRFDIVLMNSFFTKGSPLNGLNFDRTHYLEKIFCFLIIQTGYILYIHEVKPHSDKIFNTLEYVNEYLMVALTYTMLNFANLVVIQDPDNPA